MADGKRFVLHSSEIRRREESFSHPWNAKSQLIGVQLSRALGLKRTGVSIARMPRVRNPSSTTPTARKKSGSIFCPAAVSPRLMARRSRWVSAILWPFRHLRCLII
jgi:hypothetical protein